jgi:hypothetical protein
LFGLIQALAVATHLVTPNQLARLARQYPVVNIDKQSPPDPAPSRENCSDRTDYTIRFPRDDGESASCSGSARVEMGGDGLEPPTPCL